MQHHRHHLGRVAILSGLILTLGAACSGATNRPGTGPTAAAQPTVQPSPTTEPIAEPTSVPVVAPTPVTTPSAVQQPGGLRALLPLAGEYAVTANLNDHTLSVVPIGAASVAGTVQLDLAPSTIGAVPNSDTVLAADGSSSGHALAI